MLSREPTSDDLRAAFVEALADAIAGAGVPEGIGLDPETTEALLRVDQAAPHPPTELVQSARDEFEQFGRRRPEHLSKRTKLATVLPALAVPLILASAVHADPGIFTQAEAQYLEQLAGQGILPQTLGLTNGRDKVGLGRGVCNALYKTSASDIASQSVWHCSRSIDAGSYNIGLGQHVTGDRRALAVVGLRRCDASPDRNVGGPTAVAIPIFVKFYGRQAAP